MLSSGRNELDLRERLLEGNTLQVVNTIAKAFVERFKEMFGTVKDVRKELLPENQAIEWGTLDRNICLFCKQFNPNSELVANHPDGTENASDIKLRHGDEAIKFFDRVRSVLHSLPRRLDYELPEHEAEYSTPEYIAGKFTLCSHCWRYVATKPAQKKTPLCHIHDIPSTHPEYRRRERLQTRMLEIKKELREIVSDFARENIKRIHLRYFLASMCISPDGFFPYIVHHLSSLMMPLNTPDNLVRALDHPIYFNKLSDKMKKAWEFHFEDYGVCFELNYDRLLRAEAWLQAEAENKHGGKREKGKGEGEK